MKKTLQNKLVIITGQTATGKTGRAIQLSSEVNGELINADSRQIYKYLDIVSGKDLDIIKKTPIHLYDICDPKKPFSSHQWVTLAKKIITNLIKQGKTPIIVGGTYFYIAHLLYGIATEGVKPDWKLRNDLNKKSVSELQKNLQDHSLEAFDELNQSDRNNPQRLIRKIELVKKNKLISNSSKFVLTDFLKDYEIYFVGLRYKEKSNLKKALRERVKERLRKGAIEEVKELLRNGYELKDPGLSANACLEIYQYLIGQISREDLAERWVTIEMQYAKRQYTFMKRDKNIDWIEV